MKNMLRIVLSVTLLTTFAACAERAGVQLDDEPDPSNGIGTSPSLPELVETATQPDAGVCPQ